MYDQIFVISSLGVQFAKPCSKWPHLISITGGKHNCVWGCVHNIANMHYAINLSIKFSNFSHFLQHSSHELPVGMLMVSHIRPSSTQSVPGTVMVTVRN